MRTGSHDAWSSVQVIRFLRKTSESVVYQLSGTEFQDWNVVNVQRLLGEGAGGVGWGAVRLLLNTYLFFQAGGMDSARGFEDSPSQNAQQTQPAKCRSGPCNACHIICTKVQTCAHCKPACSPRPALLLCACCGRQGSDIEFFAPEWRCLS